MIKLIVISLEGGILNKQVESTKQRILAEALTLFSVKGFEPVTVAEIANAVGIKAPSLYKHYKSKQEIFEAIFIEMESRYEKQAISMDMYEIDQPLVSNIGEQKLLEVGIGLFQYSLHDDYVCKFRKMLTVERYSNKDLTALYTKRYIDEPLSHLLPLLAGVGMFSPDNQQIMVLHFYAPIFLLQTLCDCHPERENEAIQMMKQHIRQFYQLYKQ